MKAVKPVGKSLISSSTRLRVMRWSVLLLLISVFVLPVVGYVYTGNAVANAAVEEKTNPRANYWREVRKGTAGYSAVVGQETRVLIQNGGENWRQLRNGIVTNAGAIGLGFVVLALLLYFVIHGRVKLENPAGETVTRWSAFERVLHWYVATLFIILALTGLSLLYGRAVLIPLLGREGFAAWADLAKDMHNYLALLFIAGLAVMLVFWFRENILNRHDWNWLKQGGGLFGKDRHPHAGRVNAGEKLWFWLLFFVGTALCVSGFFMLFPNLQWQRETMQLANLIHATSGLILMAFSLGHIYMGTIGEEGTLEGMVSGKVDKAWARQHFDLWYQEMEKQPGQGKPDSRPPPGSGPQSVSSADSR